MTYFIFNILQVFVLLLQKKVDFNIIFRFILLMGFVYMCWHFLSSQLCICTGNLAFSFHIFHHLAVSLVNYFRAMFSNPQTLSAMSLWDLFNFLIYYKRYTQFFFGDNKEDIYLKVLSFIFSKTPSNISHIYLLSSITNIYFILNIFAF